MGEGVEVGSGEGLWLCLIKNFLRGVVVYFLKGRR